MILRVARPGGIEKPVHLAGSSSRTETIGHTNPITAPPPTQFKVNALTIFLSPQLSVKDNLPGILKKLLKSFMYIPESRGWFYEHKKFS